MDCIPHGPLRTSPEHPDREKETLRGGRLERTRKKTQEGIQGRGTLAVGQDPQGPSALGRVVPLLHFFGILRAP